MVLVSIVVIARVHVMKIYNTTKGGIPIIIMPNLDHLIIKRKDKMEWISVEDSFPKDDDYYLIWPHGKYAGVGATFWPYGNENEHVNNTFEMESEYGDITQIDVTHWMPLPDGPKLK